MSRNLSTQRGFTLMELVMVIVIAGILGTMTIGFITKPIEAYVDLSRRAELVDHAEMSMRMMARDIRRALPNSVDSGETCDGDLCMIRTTGGGRYRAQGPGIYLDFTTVDTSFEAFGIVLPDSWQNQRLVIYNLGVSGANAYSDDDVITPKGTTLSYDSSNHIIELSPGHKFRFESPSQRFFVVDNMIRYRCENSQLLREVCPISTSSSPNCYSSAPVSRHMNCEESTFSYQAGTASRAGLVTINLVLQSEGETISLLHQVHVDNVP